METQFNLNVPLTVPELAAMLRRQLPKRDRQKLIALLQDELPTADVLKAELRQSVAELNDIKAGKRAGRPIQQLLDEL